MRQCAVDQDRAQCGEEENALRTIASCTRKKSPTCISKERCKYIKESPQIFHKSPTKVPCQYVKRAPQTCQKSPTTYQFRPRGLFCARVLAAHVERDPQIYQKSPTNMSNEPHKYVKRWRTCGRLLNTGWQRCIGCLKLPVYFAERAIIHSALLRKLTFWSATARYRVAKMHRML